MGREGDKEGGAPWPMWCTCFGELEGAPHEIILEGTLCTTVENHMTKPPYLYCIQWSSGKFFKRYILGDKTTYRTECKRYMT